MAKPKKFKDYITRGYPPIGVYVTGEGDFEATVLGTFLSDTTWAGLVNKIEKHIKDNRNLDWQPFIKIIFLKPFAHRDEEGYFLGFSFDRGFIAEMPDGEVRECGWETNPSDRFDHSHNCREWPYRVSFILPYVHEGGTSTGKDSTWLVYSEEIWKGLGQLQDGLAMLKIKFLDLITTEQGQEHIAKVGAKALSNLLNAPKEESNG